MTDPRELKAADLRCACDADLFDLPLCPQILHLRSDNLIFFANADYTIEQIIEKLDDFATVPKFVMLDLQAMAFIDITGVEELRVLMDEAKARGVQVAFMGLHRPVLEVFESSGFLAEIEPDLLIKYRGDAITVLFDRIDHDYCRDKCPHSIYFECATVK